MFRIKLLVDNTSEVKALSIIRTNYIIKSSKDEKITKMMKRTADFMVGVITNV